MNATIFRAPGRALAAWLVGAALLATLVVPVARAATPADLFISEYVDGSSSKAVELFNGTGLSIDLGAGDYGIAIYANGSSDPTQVIELDGVVAAGDVFVVGDTGVPGIDFMTPQLDFNGNDAVALRNVVTGEFIDLIGQTGVNPGPTGWANGEASTNDRTLVRKASIDKGRTANDVFDPAVEWDPFPFDTTSHLGSHTFEIENPDSGVVDADVTVPTSAACVELSTTAVSFGTQRFGSVDVQASPGITITNCSAEDETLLARGTSAAGDGATWTLVDTAGTCDAGTLGTDEFHLKLRRPADEVDPVTQLGSDNKEIAEIGGGDATTVEALLDMPCPGSEGAGQTMGMSIVFVVTELE